MGVETIIMAAAAVYGSVEGQDQARKADNEKANAKKAVKAREAELAAEAAAAEATKKKAETAGQRAGFGAGGAGPSALSRSSFVAQGSGATGFGAGVKEDNLGRGSLFGN